MKADRIAEAQAIPRHFLDNILTDLRRAGIVATHRGAEGGSRLARPAKDITLADVMRAIEGPLAAVRDVRPEQLSYEGPAERLPEVWIAVRGSLRSVLEQVTVADVASGQASATRREAARRSRGVEAPLTARTRTGAGAGRAE